MIVESYSFQWSIWALVKIRALSQGNSEKGGRICYTEEEPTNLHIFNLDSEKRN